MKNDNVSVYAWEKEKNMYTREIWLFNEHDMRLMMIIKKEMLREKFIAKLWCDEFARASVR